jgi:hypothetical protein
MILKYIDWVYICEICGYQLGLRNELGIDCPTRKTADQEMRRQGWGISRNGVCVCPVCHEEEGEGC